MNLITTEPECGIDGIRMQAVQQRKMNIGDAPCNNMEPTVVVTRFVTDELSLSLSSSTPLSLWECVDNLERLTGSAVANGV